MGFGMKCELKFMQGFAPYEDRITFSTTNKFIILSTFEYSIASLLEGFELLGVFGFSNIRIYCFPTMAK